jgi:hypothetical protein
MHCCKVAQNLLAYMATLTREDNDLLVLSKIAKKLTVTKRLLTLEGARPWRWRTLWPAWTVVR